MQQRSTSKMLGEKQSEESVVPSESENGGRGKEAESENRSVFNMTNLLWHGGSVWDAWFSCSSNQVLASETKIYMILDGGELFDAILENVLVDAKGNIKISDFGLNALPQHLKDYTSTIVEEEEEDMLIDDEVLLLHEAPTDSEKEPESPTHINGFELIGMSSCLDLSGFFEKEDVSERKVRFTFTYSPRNLLERIENTVSEMGFGVQKKNGRIGNSMIADVDGHPPPLSPPPPPYSQPLPLPSPLYFRNFGCYSHPLRFHLFACTFPLPSPPPCTTDFGN
ncbi:hypothetical protein L6452_01770 [Arctium lappa]|uniref:Uncharacterized protein n=1 Tax=Arctium lappa TaxID=4217 RepID=A0ACB9FID4_ARCLA|nr:hypothetical protein L6452_01770 [Arctium lappa]